MKWNTFEKGKIGMLGEFSPYLNDLLVMGMFSAYIWKYLPEGTNCIQVTGII